MPRRVHVRIEKSLVLCETFGGIFLIFLPKTIDANLIWQTIGDLSQKLIEACRKNIPMLFLFF
jgi:hypothetical protein